MKLIDIATYLVYIAMYSIIIPVGAGIYLFTRLTKPLKILWVGLCLVLILDILLLFFDLRIANTFLYVFTAVDVLMFSFVFSLSLSQKRRSSIILVIGVLFIPLIILDALFISGSEKNGLSNAIEKIFVLAIALYFLKQLFLDDSESNLLAAPLFWVSVGVISYDMVGFFDIFKEPILNFSQNLYLQYFIFWSLVTVFMYIAFSRAFWLCNRTNTL